MDVFTVPLTYLNDGFTNDYVYDLNNANLI